MDSCYRRQRDSKMEGSAKSGSIASPAIAIAMPIATSTYQGHSTLLLSTLPGISSDNHTGTPSHHRLS